MITAEEMRSISNQNSFRVDAIESAISRLEDRIRTIAKTGERSCFADFYSYPGAYAEFAKKYGPDSISDYKQYNVEEEVKAHFEKAGFTFKLIKDDICGGVRQDPYWVVYW